MFSVHLGWNLKAGIKTFIMMLYTKERKTGKKRSYDYLHAALTSEKLKKRREKGRVSLSGKPKA